MTSPDLTNGAMNAARLGLSTDARTMLMFEMNKKEVCVAYALWFFLGYFGAHNFYLKRTVIAVVQLLLTLTIVGVVITFLWTLADAFLIPGLVRRDNYRLALTLGAPPFAN
jgi:TM2 domain-containing membrane protein YozV